VGVAGAGCSVTGGMGPETNFLIFSQKKTPNKAEIEVRAQFTQMPLPGQNCSKKLDVLSMIFTRRSSWTMVWFEHVVADPCAVERVREESPHMLDPGHDRVGSVVNGGRNGGDCQLGDGFERGHGFERAHEGASARNGAEGHVYSDSECGKD
jgi:hypothetical protein